MATEKRSVWRTLMRRRVFAEEEYETELARVLTFGDLVTLCVGNTLGLGVYVLAGTVALKNAGPGVVLSFLFAGIASVFSALCYAELAARVPRAGSAYIYTYVMIGEVVAFTIGWTLVLEYVIGTAGVARGLSGYFDSLSGNAMSSSLNETMHMDVNFLGEYPDFLAACLVVALAVLLGCGVKVSSIMNIIFTTINMGTILTVLVAGFINVDLANWSIEDKEVPEGGGSGGFLPFGLAGVMTGAAKCFFGFVGFDCIASTGEEAINPKRNIPLAIVISLVIISLVYFGISTVLTMAMPYYDIRIEAPFLYLFERLEYDTVKWIVSIGAIFALCTSLLGSMFPLPRILYAMGNDRVIFSKLSKVHPYTQTPLLATAIAGSLTALMALMFDLDQLIDMMSIGTLMAYSIVAVCVLMLRYECGEKEDKESGIVWRQFCNLDKAAEPTALSSRFAKSTVIVFCLVCIVWCSIAEVYELTTNVGAPVTPVGQGLLIGVFLLLVLIVLVIARQPMGSPDAFFTVPLVPFIPCLSVFVNFYLMFQLDMMTWIRFTIWLVIGYCIYFGYGVRNSGKED